MGTYCLVLAALVIFHFLIPLSIIDLCKCYFHNQVSMVAMLVENIAGALANLAQGFPSLNIVWDIICLFLLFSHN